MTGFAPAPTFVGFERQFHVVTDLGSGKRGYVITGTARMQFKAAGQDWSRGSITFDVPVPELAPGMGLRLIYWAPLVTLAAVSNDSVATDAGWAVDRFDLLMTHLCRRFVTVKADVAVRDADGWMWRLGYSVNLVGTPAPESGPDVH
ncbi:hypothetical protein ACQEVB_25215 [Pseudonocardia sp. CA-107938]|uniref:hypothetical protein n=1 Tax=Pseudonocardia sp. CA-107938 TaxID=3240021 RepID=UPI003D9333E9